MLQSQIAALKIQLSDYTSGKPLEAASAEEVISVCVCVSVHVIRMFSQTLFFSFSPQLQVLRDKVARMETLLTKCKDSIKYAWRVFSKRFSCF